MVGNLHGCFGAVAVTRNRVTHQRQASVIVPFKQEKVGRFPFDVDVFGSFGKGNKDLPLVFSVIAQLTNRRQRPSAIQGRNEGSTEPRVRDRDQIGRSRPPELLPPASGDGRHARLDARGPLQPCKRVGTREAPATRVCRLSTTRKIRGSCPHQESGLADGESQRNPHLSMGAPPENARLLLVSSE